MARSLEHRKLTNAVGDALVAAGWSVEAKPWSEGEDQMTLRASNGERQVDLITRPLQPADPQESVANDLVEAGFTVERVDGGLRCVAPDGAGALFIRIRRPRSLPADTLVIGGK